MRVVFDISATAFEPAADSSNFVFQLFFFYCYSAVNEVQVLASKRADRRALRLVSIYFYW